MKNYGTYSEQVFLTIVLAITAALHFQAAGDTLDSGQISIEYASDQEKVARQTMRILEDALKEYAPLLPAGKDIIYVKIVAVSDEFDQYAVRFSGLTVSGLARPQQSLIVVKAPRLRMPGEDYRGTLRHELVHLLVYRNINPAFIPIWLNEGLAMSLSNEFRWQAMFSVARMFLRGRIIPYHKLDQAFLAPSGQEQFGDAYAQALSMTRHLRNRLGEEQFWKMVREMKNQPFPKALHKITGLTIQQFWGAYDRSLWKYAAVATMASGFFFQPAAILVVLAYLRYRRKSRNLYKKWEQEEIEESQGRGRIIYWDEVVEDPDAWKGNVYTDIEDEEKW